MSAMQIIDLCRSLETLTESQDIDAVAQAMIGVQQLLATLGPTEQWVEQDGDAMLAALAQLKDTLDNMTSVFSRKLSQVERELSSLSKSSLAVGAYASLTQAS